MQLLQAAHPDAPALDMALTHALLREVGAGERPATARVYRPGATMAFGRLDAITPGYGAALAAARAHGYAPLLRLGGGHAAAYDEGSLVVDLITPQRAIAEGITERFRTGADLIVDALERVGVATRVGELPGEYCPGTWSVNAAGIKLAGAAQRSIRGASLMAAVVVVEGGDRLRDALVDVYDALDLAWDPRTAGAAEDLVPGLRTEDVEAALIDVLRERAGPLEPAAPGAGTLAATAALASQHRPVSRADSPSRPPP